MNKAELIDAVSGVTSGTKAQTGDFLDAFLGVVKESLAKGENVQLIGFGTFSVKTRAGRNGVNPATGATIQIAEKKVVNFKVGLKLQEAVAATGTVSGTPKK